MIDEQKQSNDEIIENPGKKSRKSQILGIVFLTIMTVLVLVYLFRTNDFKETMQEMISVAGVDLALALGCLLAYVLICPLSMCILCKVSGTKTSFMQNYLIGASEHFFNGITPYQTGAQPFQVYSFSKRGVKAGEGTGLVIANYFSFLIASNLLIIISLIYGKDFFGKFLDKNMIWIPIIGIVMSLFTLVLFFCLIYCKWLRDGFKKLLRWMCKFKWIGKRLSKSIPTFDEYCDNAQRGAKEIFQYPKAFAVATVLRTISLLFYYAIPFFILRGLNVELAVGHLFYVILATCFAMNAVVWIPTPGASGGIELSFTVLFSLFSGFSGAVAAAAAILWRGITYYILLIISFVEYLILEAFFKKRVPQEKVPQEKRKKCEYKERDLVENTR